MKKFAVVVLLLFVQQVFAQQVEIPKSYSNIEYNKKGELVFNLNGKEIPEVNCDDKRTLGRMLGNPIGTDKGIALDFDGAMETGVIYYGFIPFHDMKYPMPVYFKKSAKIKNGKAEIDLLKMRKKYDMISWEKNGYGTLGYRVQNEDGRLFFEGVVSFEGSGPFKIADGIIEGPSVAMTHPNSVVLRIKTNRDALVKVNVAGRDIKSNGQLHEITIDKLKPNTEYKYSVLVGQQVQNYTFKTAPKPGTRTEFSFAYASDSRAGSGGGERNLGGTNFYMVKKLLAYAKMKDVAFMQYTGDLISGYQCTPDIMRLQYANWKKAAEPWAHYFPIIPAVGNHESLTRKFIVSNDDWPIGIDRFPFETESMEAVFADEFTLPTNGPDSEDGTYFDPSRKTKDFPSYKENVYYYTYDNVAVVVLNSEYWFAFKLKEYQQTSGNYHGYLMENQMKWLKKTLAKLEKDENIDHVFVTQHTPTFPNGGHEYDAMYYGGDNSVRAIVAGKPVKKGVIDVRDEYLDLLVNKSSKVRAILTGDEHNYARTEVGPDTDIYPKDWKGKRVKLSRTIHQINNGAAGAPYYSQVQMPWTNKVSNFSTQNAIVLFNIEGKNIEMKVINPDSFDEIDEFEF
jgi:3',5'-cyclic AMP phosphodiesterase CpdA